MKYFRRTYDIDFRSLINFRDGSWTYLEVKASDVYAMMVNQLMPGDEPVWHQLYADMLVLAEKNNIAGVGHPEMYINFPGEGRLLLDCDEELLNIRIGAIAIATVVMQTWERE